MKPHKQTDLFEPPAQQHSPTSRAAAVAAKSSANRMRGLVLEYIAKNGPVTDEHIALGLSMNPSTARPRRVELQRAGRIRQYGEQKTSSGRWAAAWVVA